MDNTAIAYDFTFYGSGQQNHFTLAEEDLVEAANFQIWNNRLGLLDTIIKSLPKAVLCEIIGSLEYASSYSWEKVNADDYRLDDPNVWYRNIVI